MSLSRKRQVGLLLSSFALLALTYSLCIPIFEAPDEVWHYAYVRYLAEGHGLPSLADDESGAYQEVAQPPLYYATAALVSRLVSDDDLPELMWHNPNFGYQAGPTVNDNKNMLIHTEREGLPWRGAVLAVRLGRLVSLAFGLLTVVAAWGLGRETFPRRPSLALGAAAVVAFTPQFLFISGVVSNDSAAAALSTCTLWAIARAVNRGITPRRSLGIGLLAGLAGLTKTSCLLLIPIAGLGLLFAASPPSHRRPRVIFGHLLLVGCSAAIVGGWWYLRNGVLYHDPLAIHVHVNTPWGRTSPASLAALLSELPAVYRSFWGSFGWGHVGYPSWVYWMLGGLVAIGLTGWIVSLWRRAIPGQGRIFLLALGWWLIVCAALVQWMRQVHAPHGRLLFPAIGAWALLMVGGWASCSRLTSRLTPSLLAGLALLSLLTPWMVIRPAFTPPRLIEPQAAAATVQSTTLTYDDQARLLGVSVTPASTAPGGRLHVRACWEGLAPMETDYTVFVHLVGRNETRVGERHTYPGLGRFPTSLWPVGRAFCDVYRVPVEKWAPVPELYDVVVGLYDASNGERLVARDAAGVEVGFATVSQVRIAPHPTRMALPSDAQPLDYRLGEHISLIGYHLSGRVQSGSPLTVTLYWRAESHPGEEYRVFVHLLDEGDYVNRDPLTQHDGPPRYGRYPTSAWRAGDLVPDEHVLEIPTLALGQRVRLVAGMYRVDTMERLQITGPDGPLPEEFIPLPRR
ncbi:MAG TPA: DUF2142 domain-containing protein [Chloroflexi bacterium]|nr:DUF2142 domain-containing protein [Chloroflexota bacterium]